MNPIRLILADDHAILREGLRCVLGRIRDFAVVAEAANGRQAVALVRRHAPDVVIMDIGMPLLNGFEATRQIVEASPQTRVLVLSARWEDADVAQMAAAGASGYLAKQDAALALARAVREIALGNTFLSALIAKQFGLSNWTMHAPGRLAAKLAQFLTIRESEVLQLIAEGLATKQIADELDLSIKTIEKHRQRLMEKLDIHEIAGLTRYAMTMGVIEPPPPFRIAEAAPQPAIS